tara:strand:- start:167 stop:718 length:552 start_codon:yes stop_codon:yes gene_type:complete
MAQEFEIDTSELRLLQKQLKEFGQKDLQNTMTKVNRSISADVRDKARQRATRQNVPLAKKSSKGITSTASKTKAGITMTRNDRYPTLFLMEYGAKNWHVPFPPNSKRVGSVYYMPQRKMRKRVGKKWLGNMHDVGENPEWTTFGKKGYVVGKTLEQMRPYILETYSEKLHNALVEAVKLRKSA